MVHRISIVSNHSRNSEHALEQTPAAATLNESEKELSKIVGSIEGSQNTDTIRRRNQRTKYGSKEDFPFDDHDEEDESPGIQNITSRFGVLVPVRDNKMTIDIESGNDLLKKPPMHSIAIEKIYKNTIATDPSPRPVPELTLRHKSGWNNDIP